MLRCTLQCSRQGQIASFASPSPSRNTLLCRFLTTSLASLHVCPTPTVQYHLTGPHIQTLGTGRYTTSIRPVPCVRTTPEHDKAIHSQSMQAISTQKHRMSRHVFSNVSHCLLLTGRISSLIHSGIAKRNTSTSSSLFSSAHIVQFCLRENRGK